MKKILIVFMLLTFGFSGTVYFAYDTDDTEILSLGYRQEFKQYEKWSLLFAGSYDMDSDYLRFASFYAMPKFLINDKFSIYTSFGYGFVIDDGGIESMMESMLDYENITAKVSVSSGIAYGLGFHYKIDNNFGFGLGIDSNDLDIEYKIYVPIGMVLNADIDNIERTNFFITYSF